MNRRRCWLIALLAILCLLVSPLPANAAQRTLVAIGDSYGSGVGSYLYYDDVPECYRSPFAYPSQLAAATGLSLTLAACSGATTADVLAEQVDSISDGTDYVTISVGGNDVGFRAVIRECALPGWLGNCSATIQAGLDALGPLRDQLRLVYAEVERRAPGATVVVTGYPLMFNGTDCNPLTFFTQSEMAAINDGTVQLNDVIRAVAAEFPEFRFVDAVPAFTGHAWCDPQPWINGLTFPLVNSYHPNIAGHTAYAVLVGRALFGSPVVRQDARPLDAAAASLPAVTSAQGPTRIRILDLNRPEVTRAAARAGVTKAELRRLRAALRDGASNVELDRLDAKITAAAATRRAAR
jgi:lysophospholipase L1-like esterase